MAHNHTIRITIISVLIFAGACSTALAGDFTAVPSGLLFRPLAANAFEPRVGFIIQSGNHKLDLNIGNSIDLLQYRTDSLTVSFGADFFTSTSLRSETDFHFPVDASDYFFGFNVNALSEQSAGTVAARLRISHISAHFVDGHFAPSLGTWRDNRPPRVYSREFVDATLAFEPSALHRSLRVYAGITQLFHVDPRGLPRTSGTVGGEYYHAVTGGVNLFAACQATFMKVIDAETRRELQAGIKLGPWTGRGVKLFMDHFSGYSAHGEYFDQKITYTGFGMNIDF